MDTYCTSCGARYHLGYAHACAKKSSRVAVGADNQQGGYRENAAHQPSPLKNLRRQLSSEGQHQAPSVNTDETPAESAVDEILAPPKRGRPRIHPDRKAYRAGWQRDKRARLKDKSSP